MDLSNLNEVIDKIPSLFELETYINLLQSSYILLALIVGGVMIYLFIQFIITFFNLEKLNIKYRIRTSYEQFKCDLQDIKEIHNFILNFKLFLKQIKDHLLKLKILLIFKKNKIVKLGYKKELKSKFNKIKEEIYKAKKTITKENKDYFNYLKDKFIKK